MHEKRYAVVCVDTDNGPGDELVVCPVAALPPVGVVDVGGGELRPVTAVETTLRCLVPVVGPVRFSFRDAPTGDARFNGGVWVAPGVPAANAVRAAFARVFGLDRTPVAIEADVLAAARRSRESRSGVAVAA